VLPEFSASHATIQLYEAEEGVPAGQRPMATTGRVPPINYYGIIMEIIMERIDTCSPLWGFIFNRPLYKRHAMA